MANVRDPRMQALVALGVGLNKIIVSRDPGPQAATHIYWVYTQMFSATEPVSLDKFWF